MTEGVGGSSPILHFITLYYIGGSGGRGQSEKCNMYYITGVGDIYGHTFQQPADQVTMQPAGSLLRGGPPGEMICHDVKMTSVV